MLDEGGWRASQVRVGFGEVSADQVGFISHADLFPLIDDCIWLVIANRASLLCIDVLAVDLQSPSWRFKRVTRAERDTRKERATREERTKRAFPRFARCMRFGINCD